MPSASKDPTRNVDSRCEGKPFRTNDFFSSLLGPGAGGDSSNGSHSRQM
jgi:hypothetical protein